MYATLASRDVDCCLIPESPFYLEGPGGVLEFIEKRLREQGHTVIVIAEGAGQELILPSDKSNKNRPDAASDDLFHDVGLWCRAKSLDELATVFMIYSRDEIKSIDNFLACVSPLLCNEWFPKHSTLAFGHLLKLLEKGPVEYQRVILLMLKALLQHTPMDAAQSPHIYAIVSQLVESTLCWKALSVLEALLQSCSSLTGSHSHDIVSFENGISGTEEKFLAPQTSFKARSGPLQYGMSSTLVSVSTPGQGVSIESQRE
ncbi:hypothetical protein KIW84_070798 [Lathyrus oleraceus]|uniref:Cell morphogenesis protein C-terminal domain-containing protein n=1 Tax=Pisum sativum TaxID=3888 RepID=A0A9D4VIG4_PEA|nr:hypothetical protein KIW84_070798 [Pisum sativum]